VRRVLTPAAKLELLKAIDGGTLRELGVRRVAHAMLKTVVSCGGTVRRSLEGWAEWLGCSVSTVQRAIRSLAEHLGLEVHHRKRELGNGRGYDWSEYRLDVDRLAVQLGIAEKLNDSAPGQNDQTGPVKMNDQHPDPTRSSKPPLRPPLTRGRWGAHRTPTGEGVAMAGAYREWRPGPSVARCSIPDDCAAKLRAAGLLLGAM
jgi:predicted transcriptional regulator